MRIVFLNPVGVVGGAERVLLATVDAVRKHLPLARIFVLLLGDGPLAAQLRSRGVDVHVLTLPEILSRTGDSQLRSGRSSILSLSFLNAVVQAVPTALRFLRAFRRTLQHIRPSIIYSNGLKTHLILQWIRPASVSVLWHIHDFYSHRPLVARILRRIPAQSVTRAIAISEAVHRDTQSIMPALPVTVVHNGVNLEQFSPGHRDGTVLDQLAGLPDGTAKCRVGLVATYANWKGHDVFLQALARVPGVHGYIVGGPIYATTGSQTSLAELKALAKSLGISDRVGFVPFQADPADVYRMLDVVVHASTRAEPFGLTIVEAMACGRAVIVASAGGAAELVQDGVNALCHQPGDVDSLANAIRRLSQARGLRESLAIKARKTAQERFSQERYGREIVQVLRSAGD